MSRLLFRPSARRDFDEIADFIAEDNEERVLSFIQGLEEVCVNRASFPFSGRDCARIARGLRRFAHRGYVIYYLILPDGDGIDIVHIIHGARDHERIARDDPDSETPL